MGCRRPMYGLPKAIGDALAVEMVRRVEGRMLIRGELAEGQRVILEELSVRPGMKIKDINAATATARSPKLTGLIAAKMRETNESH